MPVIYRCTQHNYKTLLHAIASIDALGAGNLGDKGGNHPSTLKGDGAEPLHFLLSSTGYY